ncbi:hypothetical protein V8B55DRAFT_1590806 [Mucor lusitanicus]
MDGKNYSAVPPPPSLTSSGGSAPLNFNDALSKARAIAEKLKQQSAGGGASAPAEPSSSQYSPPPSSSSSGSKRGYNDDDRNDDYHGSSSRSYGSSSSYGDSQHDSKRSAYDSGSSRPSYGSSESRSRHGLGSDERRSYGGSGIGGSGGHSEDYTVPNHMVGLLIGKGGENLKKIERMSGVSKVQFANDPVGNERTVTLTGQPDQTAIARDMIQQMVADAQANERPGGAGGMAGGMGGGYGAHGAAGGNTVTMRVPVSKVGLVIGRGGETIRDFEERSKAKILIAADTGDNSSERVINIMGDDAATQMAKSMIEDVVYSNGPGGYGGGGGYGQQGGGYGQQGGYGGYSRMGRPDDDRIFITVPSSAVGLIIGRGGETVRAMQDQSGARVKIEPANEPNTEERIVNIFGDQQCVAIAKQLVEEKVAEANRGPGGRYDRYNSDRGGYRSRNDYGSNDYSQHGGGEGGYDYNQQYSQYYQQYGYAGNEDPSQAEGAAPPASSGDDKDDSKDNKAEGGENAAAQDQQQAYYAQYYGGQQPTKEQQEAYYQWYQQYYGQQQQQQQQPYGAYDASAPSDQPQEAPSEEQKENVDGEPLEDEKKDEDKSETQQDADKTAATTEQ